VKKSKGSRSPLRFLVAMVVNGRSTLFLSLSHVYAFTLFLVLLFVQNGHKLLCPQFRTD